MSVADWITLGSAIATFIAALATISIAWVTKNLYGISKKLAEQTKEALDITRDSLNETKKQGKDFIIESQRAYVMKPRIRVYKDFYLWSEKAMAALQDLGNKVGFEFVDFVQIYHEGNGELVPIDPRMLLEMDLHFPPDIMERFGIWYNDLYLEIFHRFERMFELNESINALSDISVEDQASKSEMSGNDKARVLRGKAEEHFSKTLEWISHNLGGIKRAMRENSRHGEDGGIIAEMEKKRTPLQRDNLVAWLKPNEALWGASGESHTEEEIDKLWVQFEKDLIDTAKKYRVEAYHIWEMLSNRWIFDLEVIGKKLNFDFKSTAFEFLDSHEMEEFSLDMFVDMNLFADSDIYVLTTSWYQYSFFDFFESYKILTTPIIASLRGGLEATFVSKLLELTESRNEILKKMKEDSPPISTVESPG